MRRMLGIDRRNRKSEETSGKGQLGVVGTVAVLPKRVGLASCQSLQSLHAQHGHHYHRHKQRVSPRHGASSAPADVGHWSWLRLTTDPLSGPDVCITPSSTTSADTKHRTVSRGCCWQSDNAGLHCCNVQTIVLFLRHYSFSYTE